MARDALASVTRRQLLQGLGAGGVIAATHLSAPGWVGASDLSLSDRIDLLYSNQFHFNRRGEPQITVGLMQGQREVQLSAPEGLDILPSGDGGTRIEAGNRLVVRLVEGHAAKQRYTVILQILAGSAARSIGRAAEAWEGRGLSPSEHEVGTVFGVATSLGYGVLLLLLGSPRPSPYLLPLWLILLVAIATGPTMSLVLRDSLRSFWAALALPTAVLLAAAAIWSLLLGGSEPPAAGAVLLPYCAVMAIWGLRRFLVLEIDTGAAPRGRRQAVAATPRSLGPVRELLLKELRLQLSSLLPVPLALAAFVPVWWYFRAGLPPEAGDTRVLFGVGFMAAAMLTVVVPALIGAHAVAWERQLGVLGWHLGLPVSRRLQWRLKLACCLLLTLVVGSTLGVAQVRFLFPLVSEVSKAALPPMPPTFVLVLAPVAIMACSLYGSRLAKNPFSALGFGLILVLVVAYGWKLLETTLWLAAYLPYRNPPVDGTWLVGLRPLFHPVWPSGPSRLDLLVGLTLLALILSTPRQESWLFVRRRPAAFAALLALAVAAFSQIYVLNLIAVELDRQIAANDDELASAGGADLVAGLAASLDQSLQHFAADLEPIYSYGAQVFYQDPATQYSQMKFETLFGMRRPPSTSMRMVALLDGAGAGPSRLGWQDSGGVGFWLRDFYRELDVPYSRDPHYFQFAPVGTTIRYSHDPHFQFAPIGTMDRDTVIALRPYSLAPLWFHQHRRRQFDLRVRQNLTLDALDLVRYLAHSPAVDRDHLRRLLEATPLVGVDLEPVDRAGLHNLGYVYWHLGERRRAIELFERAIVIARETGDRQGEGAALSDLAEAYRDHGDPHRAIEPFEQSIVIARELGDRWREAVRSWRLGQILFWTGEPERAGELMNFRVAIGREFGHTNVDRLAAKVDEIRAQAEAWTPVVGINPEWVDQAEQHLAKMRVTGNPRWEGHALNGLGMAYRDRGEPRRAIEYHEQAIVIAREIGDRQGEHAALGSLGQAYKDLGESRRAIELFEQAIVIAREIGDRRDEGALLGNLGLAYADLGEPRRAIELLEQAVAIAREIGDPWGEAFASWNLGLIYEESGELERAVELMEVRVAFEREIGHPDAEKHAAEVEEIRARIGPRSGGE